MNRQQWFTTLLVATLLFASTNATLGGQGAEPSSAYLSGTRIRRFEGYVGSSAGNRGESSRYAANGAADSKGSLGMASTRRRRVKMSSSSGKKDGKKGGMNSGSKKDKKAMSSKSKAASKMMDPRGGKQDSYSSESSSSKPSKKTKKSRRSSSRSAMSSKSSSSSGNGSGGGKGMMNKATKSSKSDGKGGKKMLSYRMMMDDNIFLPFPSPTTAPAPSPPSQASLPGPSMNPTPTSPSNPSSPSSPSSPVDPPSTSGGDPSAPVAPTPPLDPGSCPDVREDSCSVCGEGFCVSIPDAVLTVPGLPDSTCSEWEEAGLQGTIPDDQCASLPILMRNLCGCTMTTMPSAPSPSMPSVMTPAPTPHEFFFCHVCGDGKVIANPGAFVALPDQEENVSCSALADMGVDGDIEVDQCDALLPIVEEACGCVPMFPPCLICGVGSTISNPDGIVEFAGQPPFTCHQLVQAGFLGFIPPAQCVPIVPIAIEACGCNEVGETEPCDICGEGFSVVNPDGIVSLPGHPDLTCAELAEGTSLSDPALCPYVLPFIVEACGCQPLKFPFCSVCGEGSIVFNPDALVSIDGQPESTCGELESDGKDGLISPEFCDAFGPSIELTCGCGPDECQTFDPCEVCGAGKVISNANVALMFPGQQTFTCAEFAELGLLCRLDPAICSSSIQEIVSTVCGCEDAPPTRPPSVLQPTIPPNGCVADELGNFGSSQGEEEATVAYVYQVETIPGVSSSAVDNEMIADLEVMISNAMIPALFSGLCGTSISRRRQQQDSGVVALSSLQRDEVVSGVCEGQLADPSNNCYLVSGDATLFVIPEADVSGLTSTAQSAIQQSMDGGEMNDVDSRVVRVSYQTKSIDELRKIGHGNGDDSGTPFFVWIAVAGAVCFSGGLVLFLTRKRCRQKEENGSFSGAIGNDQAAYMQDPANDISASVYHSNNRMSVNGPPDAASEMDSLYTDENPGGLGSGYQGGSGRFN